LKKFAYAAAFVIAGPAVAVAQPVTTGIIYENITGKISLVKAGNECKLFSVVDGKGWTMTFAVLDPEFWTAVVGYDLGHFTVRVAWSDMMHYFINCPDPYGSNEMKPFPIPNGIIRQDEVP
jgi:hypothetical protein